MTSLSANVQAGFQVAAGAAVTILLVEDTERKLPAKSTNLPRGGYVLVDWKRYVKMFVEPDLFPNVQVVAVSGSLTYAGAGRDLGKSQLLSFTPTSREQVLPPGVINIRLESVGRAFTESGVEAPPFFQYNPVTRAVRCASPLFAFCTVRYDQNHYDYVYEFNGSCPLNETDSKETDYEAGAIYALYSYLGLVGNASINLSAPRCQYGFATYDYRNSGADRHLPSLSMSQDPWGAPRLIASGIGSLSAEGLFRLYANGDYADTIGVTTGFVWQQGDVYAEQVDDVLIFNNTSSASLSRQPATGVFLETLNYLSGADEFVGPGEEVTDVTWINNNAYSNPIQREVGATEVVAVDFRKSKKSYAIVRASYLAYYTKYGFGFEYDYDNGQFKSGYIFAAMNDGRATTLQMAPPNNKTVSGGWR